MQNAYLQTEASRGAANYRAFREGEKRSLPVNRHGVCYTNNKIPRYYVDASCASPP